MTHPGAGVSPAAPILGAPVLLAGLTPEQQRAVTHGEGPLLIFAGPGAGKTKTITHRIAWLMATGMAEPHEILAVTFTVRAAGEMRLRLVDMLGPPACSTLTVATFHSVCARLLRQHAGTFGRSDTYTIYDQSEVRKVIDHLLADKDRRDVQAHIAALGQTPSAEILREISLAKARLQTPETYPQFSKHPVAPLVSAVWRELEEELCACNAFDFDDLLVYASHLLGDYPALLAHYRERWRWMLVDEFQDTNHAQATLVHQLAGPNGNLTVVGDDDQAIYGFRAAQVRHMLGFGELYPGHRTIVLGRNFRCREEILTAAVSAVRHNSDREPKQLVAVRGPGGIVQSPWFANDWAEAEWAAKQVRAALDTGVEPADIIVIARTGYATLPVQGSLAAHDIPHRVLGSLGLYERSEVKDALAYLALIVNAADGQAFRRAVAAPKRGVGTATATRAVDFAREHTGGDILAACAAAARAQSIRNQRTKERLAVFGSQLQRIRADLHNGRSIGHTVVETVMLDGGLVRHYEHRRDSARRPEDRRDAERVLEDLRSLCRSAGAYEQDKAGAASLVGFLEQAAGLNSQEVHSGQDNRITVSTIHRAKGTEAHLVIVLGCEERLLPSWRSIESIHTAGLQEERRLFYVAATRAKGHLILSGAAERTGRPTAGRSRFLDEATATGPGANAPRPPTHHGERWGA